MTDPRYPTRRTIDPDLPLVHGKAGAEGDLLRGTKQVLDTMLGRSGDPQDAVVRVRDLVNLGVASFDPSGGANGTAGAGPRGGGPGGNPFLQPPRPGTNPRPTVFTGLRTIGLWNGIRIYWDYPPLPPSGAALEYAGVEVYGAEQVTGGPVPTFANAAPIGSVSGAVNFFTHDLGPTGFGKVWYYWLRWLYLTSTQFPIPFSQFTPGESAPGLRGQSDPSPAQLVQALVGQIQADSLNLGLADRIAAGTFSTANVPTTVNGRLLVLNGQVNGAIAEVAALRQAGNILTGTYSMRVDLNGYVTGFGLVARYSPGGDLNPILPGDQQYESAFIIRANRFAIEVPTEPGAPPSQGPRYPFVVGQIINPDWQPPADAPDTEPTIANGGLIDAVGITGRLAVRGTIHGDAISAGTIKARHIDAASVSTTLLSAERIITGSLTTAGDSNWRVFIGGAPSLFPLWYGLGQIGDTTIYDSNGAVISGPAFSLDRFGNCKLAGQLTVTGGGRFSTSNGASDARVEIGGGDGLLFWAGSGSRTRENGKLVFDAEGNIFVRGLPLTVPAAANTNDVAFTVIPQAGQPTGKVLIMGHCVVYENPPGQSGDDDIKSFVLEILVNGQPVQGMGVEEMRLEQMPVTIMHIGDYAGTINVSLRVTGTRGASVSIKDSNIILLQVQGGT